MSEEIYAQICSNCSHEAMAHVCSDCDVYDISHREAGMMRGDHGGCAVRGCPCSELGLKVLVGLEAAVWLTENKRRERRNAL